MVFGNLGHLGFRDEREPKSTQAEAELLRHRVRSGSIQSIGFLLSRPSFGFGLWVSLDLELKKTE